MALFQVFLIRHGEVEGNSGPHPTFAGWVDKPLTIRGQAQAAAIARRLSTESLGVVWSSDLQRARITAEAIAEPHGLEVRTSAALREVSYGAWEGLGEAEILRQWQQQWLQRVADPEKVGPPEGESYADLWRRLEPIWDLFLKESEASGAKSNVLVAHNGTLRILLCHILGIPIANYRRLKISNCGLTRLEVSQTEGIWSFVVSGINETTHLQGV
jgi:broad specificity phosphatase PhoE